MASNSVPERVAANVVRRTPCGDRETPGVRAGKRRDATQPTAASSASDKRSTAITSIPL